MAAEYKKEVPSGARADDVNVCDVSEDAKKQIKAFKRRQTTTNCALLLKIDKANLTIVVDEMYEDLSLEELQEEIPAHEPRYALYIYKNTHGDGRISYPLCFIYVTPPGLKPELNMMYAGSKTSLINETKMTKIFECRDVEELTEEWLRSQLGIR
ncbi:Glia maturation factor beta [Apostichopus japonicus]|uniref:Glia maturation factor beta n=1 Tax=Stichopus japonicus TaxID=307972 RepID=A0A2G8K9Q6_STIJA|nr:Glia maturation factor beta [Apostichopus japonicus]